MNNLEKAIALVPSIIRQTKAKIADIESCENTGDSSKLAKLKVLLKTLTE